MSGSHPVDNKGLPCQFSAVLTIAIFVIGTIVCLLDAVFGFKVYWLAFAALVGYCVGAPWLGGRKKLDE